MNKKEISEIKKQFSPNNCAITRICGVENEKLETFDQTYEAIAGENASLMASNITNTRRTEIKTPDVVIHIDPDRAALIETQVIDGRKCIVIPMEGDVEINGIHVSSGNSESTES